MKILSHITRYIFFSSWFIIDQSIDYKYSTEEVETMVSQNLTTINLGKHSIFMNTGSPHFTRFHFTRFTLYTTFRKITSLLVKFTLYTEKNSAKWIFVLMKFMFHFTLLFMKNKMWGLSVVFYIIFF